MEGLLLRVRMAGLTERYAPVGTGRLSVGPLFGAETKAGLVLYAGRQADVPITLVGDRRLTERHATSMQVYGFGVREAPGDVVPDVADVLMLCGITSIEVRLNSPQPLSSVRFLRQRLAGKALLPRESTLLLLR